MWNDSTLQEETGFVRTPGGLRLRFRRAGDGPTILLLHAWPQTGHAWRRVMPTLAMAGYTVVAPDRRGSGDSDKPTGGYDLVTQAGDMRALLATLGLPNVPAFVVGHGDGGGGVAEAFARAYPQETAALALIGVAPDDGQSAAEWHVGFHRTPDLPEALIAPHLGGYVRHFLRGWAHDPRVFSEADIQVYVDALSAPGALRASLASYRAEPPAVLSGMPGVPRLRLVGESDPRLRLVGESDPRLRLVGESDPRLPTGGFPDVPGGAPPGTRLQVIPRGGHWLPEERPDAVAAALLTFARENDVPGDR